MVSVTIITLLFMCSSILPASDGKSDIVRICVSANPNLKGSHAVKYCDLLARSKKTQATCVFGNDRVDCLKLISERKADFTVLEAEDLIFAKNWPSSNILVVSEIRADKKDLYRYQAVVVIRNNKGVSSDLKGARLCHPGFDTYSDKSVLFDGYLEERLAPQSCNANMTLQEDRIRTTASYFGPSCRAGVWSDDKDDDIRMKKLYHSLCDRCSTPSLCSKNDKYWGSGGAITCLKDGFGDALWTTIGDVNTYFLNSEERNEYSFLCENGSILPLNSSHFCPWLARPWKVIAANRKTALDVHKTVVTLKEDKEKETEWKKNLLSLIELFDEYIINLEPSKTPEDYLDAIPGFLSASEMTMTNCNPRHQVVWCTLNGLEHKKCSWISMAASAFAINPTIVCIHRPSIEECMVAVQSKEADVVVVRPDYMPIASLQYNLKPIFFESFKNQDTGYNLSAYVKANSNLKKASDLRSQRACFTQHNGLGWRAALTVLREAELVSNTCSSSGVVQGFFLNVCVTSGPETSDIPRCCAGQKLEGDPDEMALNCMANGGCDVAFVKSMNLPRKADTNGTSNHGWFQDDFRTICAFRPGNCSWTWSAPSALMVSEDISAVRYRETFHVFYQISEQFVRRNKKNDLMLSIFGPFLDEPNVIFQDTSVGFLSKDHFLRSRSVGNSAMDVINKTKYCSSSSTYTSSFIVICLSLLFIFSR